MHRLYFHNYLLLVCSHIDKWVQQIIADMVDLGSYMGVTDSFHN